ncbi:hypothetical protein GQX73_g2975 [Xylaria multiplex]|uniref:Uncharacterized protein n=1 Tax=Xylaria multiplex TaxID=323545 RepID=A0A7C8IUZ0_9PEZI|nr:hypothetical protein GQX73_g2975 [Xylaria multiplex]
MAPATENFRKIAEEAERNLNTYEAKTGAHKTSHQGEAGVDTGVESQFLGAEVRYGQDLSTNAGYNRRIPPEEDGALDARGQQTRGEHFEGVGGPEHKLGQQMREYGGSNEFDPANKRRHDTRSKASADDTSAAYSKEVMTEGREAALSNMESNKYVPHKGQYPGSEYQTAQEVPGDMSAEGYEAPESVTEVSRESGRFQG